MASTYSNLKIQLMATGENNSTWGTVTNTNLGTAIEEAITGSADVTFASGDVTLTLTNTNATQTARNLRLNLTGTTGGARNLVVPAIEKLYLVNNGCADAVTVKNSTGSGVAVPAGKTMYVYNTGSNVVDAITHLTSLTLASPLPVASGGTGSTTATFSGENITNLNASNISSGTIANARTTAASANGASTIVARDVSGNFSANTVTANLTGTASNATVLQTARTIAIQDGATGTATSFDGSTNISIPVTAINASVINTGTIANARTTASSNNGASTIVARDASGNFSAGFITANLSGNASTATSAVNAGSSNLLTTARNFSISGGATAAAVSFNGGANVDLSVTSLNASSVSTGTLSNDRTTATFSNGANTIVARDASGNFSANTITANLTGTASGNLTSGSGLNATNLTSGTIPAARFPSGSIVKTQTYVNGTYATFSGYVQFPIDNTIPQSNEGALLFSTTYTPLFSDSIIRIDFSVNMGSLASSRNLYVAVFSSLSTNALGCTYETAINNGDNHIVSLTTYMTASTTSAITFSLRGSDNGPNTIYINGNGSTQLFGGVFYSSMTFTEYRP